MSVAIIAAVIGLAGVAYGASQNKKEGEANRAAYADTREDYESRIKAAQVGLAQMEEQYNKVREERPDLSWNGYVGELVTSLNDEGLTKAYAASKGGDFNVLRTLAKSATEDNTTNFKATLNSVSNGRASEIINQRNDLVLNDDVKKRYERALELRAPDIGAGTVKYDSKGNLVEGQRADKQVFQTAYEVEVETNKERLQNLGQLEKDRSNIAQAQQEKALDFMPFYDSTGLKINAFADNRKERLDFQKSDEEMAFKLYSAFATAASGIQPGQAQYTAGGSGNALIQSGLQTTGTALGSYYTKNQTSGTKTGGSETIGGSSNATYSDNYRAEVGM